MELNKPQPNPVAKKLNFRLNTKSKDGVVLQLHHTVYIKKYEKKRLLFSYAVFNNVGDHLACIDEAGNVFILDFIISKYWKLKEIGCGSVLSFLPDKEDTLLIGFMSFGYPVCFLDTESGIVSRKLKGHTSQINQISFSRKSDCLLTSSIVEAILWKLSDYSKYYTLNTQGGILLQDIKFIPASDVLVACFKNDTIQIWKSKTMKTLKHIVPHHMKNLRSITLSQNGRVMVMAGLSSILTLFCLDTWSILKLIDLSKYKIFGVVQVNFIPQHFDGGANKILCLYTSDAQLQIIDLEMEISILSIPKPSSVKSIAVSQNGRYLTSILELGEIYVYKTSQMLNLGARGDMLSLSSLDQPKPTTSELSKDIQTEMKRTLDPNKLRLILKLQGSYPDRYRNIIWGVLLGVPENNAAFTNLTDKPLHPTYRDLESKFNISSRKLFKILKKMLSCLTYWAPVFGLIDYLPYLIFPFVVTLQKYPLFLFEVLATVFVNYCQLWFEFTPLPPINVLGMIENILAQKDADLLKHFYDSGITSQDYALPLMITGFSEVLTRNEWLLLWDHIFSNEPAFVLMAVVAYNLVNRDALKKIKLRTEFVKFFHTQNKIDMKYFIRQCYYVLKETNDDTHPRKYFKPFFPLQKGSHYQQFTGYPKSVLCMKMSKDEDDERKADDLKLVARTESKCNSKKKVLSNNRSQMLGKRRKYRKRIKSSGKVLSSTESGD